MQGQAHDVTRAASVRGGDANVRLKYKELRDTRSINHLVLRANANTMTAVLPCFIAMHALQKGVNFGIYVGIQPSLTWLCG